jgi:hypothetical protein
MVKELLYAAWLLLYSIVLWIVFVTPFKCINVRIQNFIFPPAMLFKFSSHMLVLRIEYKGKKVVDALLSTILLCRRPLNI